VVDRSPSAQLDTVAILCLDALSSASFSNTAPINSPHNFIHRNGCYTARLDRCYARQSPHISTSLSLLHRFPSLHHGISDHIPTIVHLLTPEPILRGSPFWQLNTAKINSQSVNTLTHALVPLARLDPLSILNRWEGVKDTVHSIFSYKWSHWQDKKEFPGDHSSLLPQQLDPLKAQYEKRLLLGCISTDRACELPSPLISHMIDRNINENHIPGIHTPDGSVSTQQEDIHNSFHSFYSDLYSPKPTSTTHINKHIPRLPTELIASLSNPFTIADVLCITKKAKKNSAPGLDGVLYSLYESPNPSSSLDQSHPGLNQNRALSTVLGSVLHSAHSQARKGPPPTILIQANCVALHRLQDLFVCDRRKIQIVSRFHLPRPSEWLC